MYSSTRLCHISKSVCVRCFDQMAKRAHPFFKVQKDSDFQVLLFLHYLHIGYIGILICISTLLHCKTVRIFAYSSTREQSNILSLHTPVGRVRLARFARVRLLRHALPISLLILRKKPTVLQSSTLRNNVRYKDNQKLRN